MAYAFVKQNVLSDFIFLIHVGAREMTQLRALVLVEDLGSVLSTRWWLATIY